MLRLRRRSISKIAISSRTTHRLVDFQYLKQGASWATRLELARGTALFTSLRADNIELTGLVIDGQKKMPPERRALVHLTDGKAIRITDCDILNAGRNGMTLERIGGPVLGCHIEDIKAGPGGSGQYGNAINAFRAGNVIVRGNRIRNCDYSAVRGNSSSNIQITGNSVSDVREVALYSEFSFEGAVIANNTVDGAAFGVSVCNFNEGGRLAVVQGNIIRNLRPKRPIGTAPDDDAGIGIYVEADSSVTGNVIENAPAFGIVAGWGQYLRDIVISGNLIRKAFAGIGVSVASGAGTVLVNTNVISETPRGAVVGLDHLRPVTPDLTEDGAPHFAQVVIGTNAVRS